MQSTTTTPEAYLAALPEERRATVETVREAIRSNLPSGYDEVVRWGMITYEVPLERFPDTYNGQPLMYAALAAQKRHYAVYLTALYQSEEAEREFRDAYASSGKKLDLGKSCVRFKKLDDLPLDVIGQAIASMPIDAFIETYRRSREKVS
jgi:uncharacterized protein YdhG (YjbR/CyaY superfamily)